MRFLNGSEYHYPDVIWHDIRSIKLKQKLTAELTNMTADEYKALLLSNLFLGVRAFKERLQNVLDLEGFDPCIASQLLAAVNNNEYTIYHENVVSGIEDF